MRLSREAHTWAQQRAELLKELSSKDEIIFQMMSSSGAAGGGSSSEAPASAPKKKKLRSCDFLTAACPTPGGKDPRSSAILIELTTARTPFARAIEQAFEPGKVSRLADSITRA